MVTLIQMTGRLFLQFILYLGQLAGLIGEVWTSLTKAKIRFKQVWRQVASIGVGSQPVVIITGAFTGAVFSAQIFFKFNDLGLETGTGALVSVALCRELAPVLTGLMVTGRVGAAMAAEIGTMKVTEQIDALRALAVHPVDYLVTPRVIATLVSMPLLIAESITFGIIASLIVCGGYFNIPIDWYWQHLSVHTESQDIVIGMTKGFVFGILIVVVSCHQGLKASNGAVGVGLGTTTAVVNASLAILIVNFFLTILLNFFFPLGGSA